MSKKNLGKLAILLFTLLLITLALASENTFAATVSGSIYDLGLDKESDVIITINTIPEQTIISKSGDYALNVNPGEYTIHAFTFNSEAFENISITDDGDYNIDIVLLDSLSESYIYDDFSSPDSDNNGIDVSSDIPLTKDYSKMLILLLIVVIVIIIGLYIFLFHIRNKTENVIEEEIKHSNKNSTKHLAKDLSDLNADDTHVLDEYEKKILMVIKQEKRTTQKDIRKEIPLSESKVSLVIADLENKGKIRKIKKGRGNILIFVKD